jgi:hypothetical protein
MLETVLAAGAAGDKQKANLRVGKNFELDAKSTSHQDIPL